MTEAKVTCVFNKSHQILKSRLAKHLTQCEKNHPHSGLRRCVYNAVHYIPAAKYQEHLETCEDRKVLERIAAPVGPAIAEPKLEVSRMPEPTAEEDWDNAPESVSYLEMKNRIVKEKPVLVLGELNCGKAKKRDFRAAEAQRHIALMNQGKDGSN